MFLNIIKMKTLKKFYNSTKYFWIISRILFILLFSTVILKRITEFSIPDLIVNSVILIVVFSMIVITISGFLKKKSNYSLRFIVGAFMVLFGFLMSYLLLSTGTKEYSIYIEISFQLLPLWIVFYGIYEIINGISSLKNRNV
jgi:uncharacterized membrane protein